MIKNNSKNVGWLAAAALLCFAPAAFGACSPSSSTPTIAGTACMDLLNPGYMGYPYANIYVGPYTASINGGTPTPVICDDFLDDSYIPGFWTANIYGGAGPYAGTRMSTLANGSAAPEIRNLTSAQVTQAYNEIGYLAIQLLGTTDSVTAAELHFALWSVFDTTALPTLEAAAGWPSSSVYQAALGFYNTAVSVAAGDNQYISQFTIYSPDLAAPYYGSTVGNTYPSPPQEFLVRTPEPPFFAVLGVDLTGVGALIFFFRRRRSVQS